MTNNKPKRLRTSAKKPYHDQIWHYQIKQWRQDGPEHYITIITNGCTDSIDEAYRLYQTQSKPTHIYDCYTEQIIISNY